MYTEEDVRRLTWQCRRGMLELDVLFVPFMEQAFAGLSEKDKDIFVRLLACEDQDLFFWLMRRGESPDTELQYMVNLILQRVQPA
ncbi:MAG: succinate dehydrogenase assembly factor 2 [Pseudomonadales bacterium]|nr:succinate dehydrogenase assembly factor 2 [Pseudomonadales bacterium]NRA16310.1 succinate dehydrogenase assembly factor 2 [Oceanospirillaceae bacterium]